MSKRPPRDREQTAARRETPPIPPAAASPLPDRPRRRPWLLALSIIALVAWFVALAWMAWRY